MCIHIYIYTHTFIHTFIHIGRRKFGSPKIPTKPSHQTLSFFVNTKRIEMAKLLFIDTNTGFDEIL